MAGGPRMRLRKLGRRVRIAAEYERLAHSRRSSVDDHTVLYESFSGNGMLCNPEAIFRALLAAPDMAHLTHVWALSDLEQYAGTVAEFADHPRVRFVVHDSHAYYDVLARAKYLVNNATFPPQFGKREGQVYLNTWHGTPLKAMGYDIPRGAGDARNVVRNFLAADYLMAPNEDTAEMYLSAYRMRNIFRGRLLTTGTPRIDAQFAGDTLRAEVRARLRRHGVVVGDEQQVILYAPTWKGSFYAPTNDIRQLRARIEAVTAQIDTSRYRLLLKVHQQVYKHAIAHPELRELLVPNEIPTNEVLASTDVLVTDYSSIFMDFLATGRPVLFYTPDIADYESGRGLYLPVDEWPGPVCRDLDQLVAAVKHLGSGGDDDPSVVHRAAYDAARARYTSHEDGHAAERVVDVVFRGREVEDATRSDFSDGRTSVLIHLGGMLSNGITTSALCLLDNIDHDRFDVSVTFPWSASLERQQLFALINPRVRWIPRFGGINGSKVQVTSLLSKRPQIASGRLGEIRRHEQLLRDEWVRCFGDTRFDHVVDFSGYAPFWLKLLAMRGHGSFSVWLHNDIEAEVSNPGRSKGVRESIAAVMPLYRHADHLVSVSEALHEVNRTKLAHLAPADRFTFARNTINFERIQHLASGIPTGVGVATGGSAVLDPAAAMNPTNLPAAVQQLIERFGGDNVRDEVERRVAIATVLPVAPGVRTFVTAGRLSTEKNHARMIKAFGLVHEEDPNTRLVILGQGPQRATLIDAITESGLGSAVTLAGHQRNPYAILANSDCFVLSSDYEGQPMVLLEAMVLGLPIVTTEFGSVRGALPQGYGLVVGLTDAALAAGMRAFLRGDVPTLPFDSVAYNRTATGEFYRAVGAA